MQFFCAAGVNGNFHPRPPAGMPYNVQGNLRPGHGLQGPQAAGLAGPMQSPSGLPMMNQPGLVSVQPGQAAPQQQMGGAAMQGVVQGLGPQLSFCSALISCLLWENFIQQCLQATFG